MTTMSTGTSLRAQDIYCDFGDRLPFDRGPHHAGCHVRRLRRRRRRLGARIAGAADQNRGWQPETFASAQEFLSRPRATVPSCLVLDVTLPGLNGLELQQQLAERTDMPIIFITGHGDVPMTVQAMKAGAVEFLTKPFKDDVLLDAIRGAIERSRAASAWTRRCEP